MKLTGATFITTLTLVAATFGCSSGDDGTSGRQSKSNGSGAAAGGDCSAPTCNGCAVCFDSCYCETGSLQGCKSACGLNGGGSGVGGSGVGGGGAVPGTGGSGSGTGGSGSGTGGSGAGGTGPGGSGGTPQQVIEFDMDPFTLQPGGETFMCQNFANPLGGADIIFDKTESYMESGSHHMFVMEDETVQSNSGLMPCTGLEFKTLVHSSQTSGKLLTTTYPPGIGIKMSGNKGFRILAHYFNTQPTAVTARVSVSLYLADPANIKDYAAAIFANDPFLNIQPYSQGVAGGRCSVPYNINILHVASHMHSHATGFVANTNTGQEIYKTTEWSEPEAAVFNPPLAIPAGATIQYSCTYQNNTSDTLTFGESAKTNEMCILSGRYFPAPDGNPISCVLGF